jgi:hypothetical protein
MATHTTYCWRYHYKPDMIILRTAVRQGKKIKITRWGELRKVGKSHSLPAWVYLLYSMYLFSTKPDPHFCGYNRNVSELRWLILPDGKPVLISLPTPRYRNQSHFRPLDTHGMKVDEEERIFLCIKGYFNVSISAHVVFASVRMGKILYASNRSAMKQYPFYWASYYIYDYDYEGSFIAIHYSELSVIVHQFRFFLRLAISPFPFFFYFFCLVEKWRLSWLII